MVTETHIKEIKQKIVAVLVLTVMFGLVFTTLNLNPNYVSAATTNAFVNITAGTLSIDSSTNTDLGSMVAGNSQEMSSNNVIINVKDFAGDGLNWAATAYSTNFKNGAGGTLDIPNSRFNMRGASGTIYNIGTASCSEIARGAICTLNQSCSVMNGSVNATGECRLNNTNLSLSVKQTDPTAYYNATITLTVSAS